MTLTPERIAEIKALAENAIERLEGAAAVSANRSGPSHDPENKPQWSEAQAVRALITRIDELEREIAALEAQIEALKGEGGEPRTTSIKAASREAARRERERCAKTCDLAGYGPASGWTAEQAEWWEIGVIDGSRMCADRIRALEDEA